MGESSQRSLTSRPDSPRHNTKRSEGMLLRRRRPITNATSRRLASLWTTPIFTRRGSDENGSWMKLPNLGHRMAKTKYDWSGDDDKPNWTGVGNIKKMKGKK